MSALLFMEMDRGQECPPGRVRRGGVGPRSWCLV